MTAVGSISATEEIVKVTWWYIQSDGAAAVKLSERSPDLTAKEVPGAQPRVSNVGQMKQINCHLARSEEDGALESILDT